MAETSRKLLWHSYSWLCSPAPADQQQTFYRSRLCFSWRRHSCLCFFTPYDLGLRFRGQQFQPAVCLIRYRRVGIILLELLVNLFGLLRIGRT